eukprot:1686792-Heterocapsa_arctica.AAC.1
MKAFCEEYNGASEDARRPFENLRKPSETLKNIESHIHLAVGVTAELRSLSREHMQGLAELLNL